MKTILFTLFVLISTSTFSQNKEIYNDEWYSSLETPIEFITFRRQCESKIQFRIYRGLDENYKVSIINSKGDVICEKMLKREDELDISRFYHGIYYIKAEDSKGNCITKEIIIG